MYIAAYLESLDERAELLKEVFRDPVYDEAGRPFITHKIALSLSHNEHEVGSSKPEDKDTLAPKLPSDVQALLMRFAQHRTDYEWTGRTNYLSDSNYPQLREMFKELRN